MNFVKAWHSPIACGLLCLVAVALGIHVLIWVQPPSRLGFTLLVDLVALAIASGVRALVLVA